MEYEIVKDKKINTYSIFDVYHVKRKLFGFIPWYVPSFEKGSVNCVLTMVGFVILEIILCIIVGIFLIQGFYLKLFYPIIIEFISIVYLRYVFRTDFDYLSEAENKIKYLIEYKMRNVKVVKRYILNNNELIIEKSKELGE